jgi:hypothetical protein
MGNARSTSKLKKILVAMLRRSNPAKRLKTSKKSIQTRWINPAYRVIQVAARAIQRLVQLIPTKDRAIYLCPSPKAQLMLTLSLHNRTMMTVKAVKV